MKGLSSTVTLIALVLGGSGHARPVAVGHLDCPRPKVAEELENVALEAAGNAFEVSGLDIDARYAEAHNALRAAHAARSHCPARAQLADLLEGVQRHFIDVALERATSKNVELQRRARPTATPFSRLGLTEINILGSPWQDQILDARAALVAMEAALPARLRTQDVAGLIGVVRSRADVKRLIIKARGHYRRARSVGLYLTRIELNVGLLSLLLGDLQDATRCLERAAALELDGGFRLYALEVLDAARQLLGH